MATIGSTRSHCLFLIHVRLIGMAASLPVAKHDNLKLELDDLYSVSTCLRIVKLSLSVTTVPIADVRIRRDNTRAS